MLRVSESYHTERSEESHHSWTLNKIAKLSQVHSLTSLNFVLPIDLEQNTCIVLHLQGECHQIMAIILVFLHDFI